MLLNFDPAFERLLCAGFCPETDSRCELLNVDKGMSIRDVS